MSEASHSPENHTPAPVGEPSLFSRIIAVFAFIVTVIIILWGIIHIIALVRGVNDPLSFGSWFSPSARPVITVNAPSDVTSGAETTIGWQYNTTGQGSYAFMYTCADGVSFDAIIPGSHTISLPCGTAITASTTNNTIAVMPLTLGTSIASTSISIMFTPNGSGSPAEGHASIHIHPGVAPEVSTSTTENVARVPRIKSPADFTVRIVSVGTIDPRTGAYVPDTPRSLGDTVVVRFDIANSGGTATGPWTFDAELPTINGYHYVSPIQNSLSPGDHILNTLRFTEIASGGGTFSVDVNGDRAVKESNYMNNSVSTNIPATDYQ